MSQNWLHTMQTLCPVSRTHSTTVSRKKVGRHREYSVSSLCPLLVWVGGYTSAFVRRLPCPAQHSCCSPTTFYTRNVCLFLPAVTFGAVRSTGCRMMQTLRGGEDLAHVVIDICVRKCDIPGKVTAQESWLSGKGDFLGKVIFQGKAKVIARILLPTANLSKK